MTIDQRQEGKHKQTLYICRQANPCEHMRVYCTSVRCCSAYHEPIQQQLQLYIQQCAHTAFGEGRTNGRGRSRSGTFFFFFRRRPHLSTSLALSRSKKNLSTDVSPNPSRFFIDSASSICNEGWPARGGFKGLQHRAPRWRCSSRRQAVHAAASRGAAVVPALRKSLWYIPRAALQGAADRSGACMHAVGQPRKSSWSAVISTFPRNGFSLLPRNSARFADATTIVPEPKAPPILSPQKKYSMTTNECSNYPPKMQHRKYPSPSGFPRALRGGLGPQTNGSNPWVVGVLAARIELTHWQKIPYFSSKELPRERPSIGAVGSRAGLSSPPGPCRSWA